MSNDGMTGKADKQRTGGMPSRALTPPQVADRLSITPEKVLHWIRSGELRAVNVATKLGGRPRYRVIPADLAAFESRRAAVPDPRPVRKCRRKINKHVIE